MEAHSQISHLQGVLAKKDSDLLSAKTDSKSLSKSVIAKNQKLKKWHKAYQHLAREVSDLHTERNNKRSVDPTNWGSSTFVSVSSCEPPIPESDEEYGDSDMSVPVLTDEQMAQIDTSRGLITGKSAGSTSQAMAAEAPVSNTQMVLYTTPSTSATPGLSEEWAVRLATLESMLGVQRFGSPLPVRGPLLYPPLPPVAHTGRLATPRHFPRSPYPASRFWSPSNGSSFIDPRSLPLDTIVVPAGTPPPGLPRPSLPLQYLPEQVSYTLPAMSTVSSTIPPLITMVAEDAAAMEQSQPMDCSEPEY